MSLFATLRGDNSDGPGAGGPRRVEMAPHLEHRPSGWCGRDTPDPHIKEARRVVRLGKPHTELPSNRISNTKYNPITFIPVNIAEQFALSMNRYFLLIACLQVCPSLPGLVGLPPRLPG